MKKKYLYSTILAGVLSISYSCTNLELDDTDSISRDASGDGFNGVENVESSLTNAYNSIQGHLQTQENLYALQEATSDELLIPTRGTDWGDNGVWRTLHQHTWDGTHRFILNTWNNFNSSIYSSTEIIETDNANAQQIAEAKFLRAFSMYWIIDLYGQVPFRKVTEGPDVNPQIMSRTEAFEFAIKDLEEALPNLPSTAPGENTDRASKAAAHFLMAKLYLNKFIYYGETSASSEDMNAVIEHVNAVMNEGFALQNGFFEIFEPEVTEADTEIVFRVKYGADARMWSTLHYNQTTPDNTGGGWNGFSTLAEFYDLFEGDPQINTPGSGQEERRGAVPLSGDEPGTNIGHGFLINQQYAMDGSKLTDRAGNPLVFTKQLPGLIGNNERNGIRVLKYHPSDGAYPNNLIVFRYADAHLMKAEAVMRGGNANQSALELVNQLRTIRDASPLSSLSEQDLLDERGRELYIEFCRRQDQIRFGTFNSSWELKDNTEEFRVLFPIPSVALTSNPNLAQNPGY
ncbi:MAG: RagB/SusD family nutrient uptake outer membrane protein [Zunongwangia sp.]|uniref:RagB/SusD family nutrient uptake outer membrane protein n=1 Tax=Zunongwangia sp. TaxID=1965325 RepID=UPI003241F3C0